MAPRRDSGIQSKPLLTFFTPLAPRWFPPRFPRFPPASPPQPEACRRASGVRFNGRVASSGHLSSMPTLRLVDGLPLIVDGELATADACCCGSELNGCCCVDGVIDTTKTTRTDCQAAGGVWYSWTTCEANPCGCESWVNGFGGCMSAECEEDWIALLSAAGYHVPLIGLYGEPNACGQRSLGLLGALCCGVVGEDCGTMTVNVRCFGPCGQEPPCNDPELTVEVTIPICCNPFP